MRATVANKAILLFLGMNIFLPAGIFAASEKELPPPIAVQLFTTLKQYGYTEKQIATSSYALSDAPKGFVVDTSSAKRPVIRGPSAEVGDKPFPVTLLITDPSGKTSDIVLLLSTESE